MKIGEDEGYYDGQVNDEGKVHGEGILENCRGHVFRAFYVDGKANGFCKQINIVSFVFRAFYLKKRTLLDCRNDGE